MMNLVSGELLNMQATAFSILPLAPGKYLEMPSRNICMSTTQYQGLHHARRFVVTPVGQARSVTWHVSKMSGARGD